jgi:D-tyrosyl-tRNA(Tyr) deacylase
VRALVQRVSRASVSVGDEEVGSIGSGLVVFLAVGEGDDEEAARYLVDKIVNLRIFNNNEGKFQSSALELGAELLLVSQFTLYADTRKGRRPSFTGAAAPAAADALYQRAVDLFRLTGLTVATGLFQAYMQVELINDGPVTIWLDSADRQRSRRG